MTAPIDDHFANTRELLDAAAATHGSTDAYVADGRRISFADWVSRARRVAGLLHDSGLAKGDVVALAMPSGVTFATYYAAAAMMGIVTTGLNPRLGAGDARSILSQAGARLVITDKTAASAPIPPEFASVTTDELESTAPVIDSPPLADVSRSDPVVIIFSSGTTGKPKGAWFDADNLAAMARAAGVMSAPYDRRMTSTPFSHAGYLSKLWDQLIWGTTLVIPPAPWTAQGMARTLTEERVTVGGAVPTQWAKLLALPGVGRSMFPYLRVGVVASAPASPDLVRRAAELIGVPLIVRYAMTECPTVCGTEPDDSPEVQAATVGRPQVGVALRVTDDEGMAVPAGTIGRIRLAGDCLMRGYWNDADLTREATDADGHFVTSDLGRLTADGDLELVGRAGDMYIRGGFNVQPVEVEQHLARHPGVHSAAVVGHPAAVIGEIGVAFIVARDPSAPPTLAELRDWVSAELADYKAPDHRVLLAEIPRTPLEKVDRVRLRQLLSDNPPPPRGTSERPSRQRSI